ncbi:COG3178: Predicted phosphotransferase related to Ser/Thr protein kinases [Pseudoalteromonas luteoviolacea B = ATCC 29581]|nr:COG3178: Predicted phosphotransferase related to Ser/Thr protein kinases [Pseudoalteromonas luteoviolacea B = ATCC 29581]
MCDLTTKINAFLNTTLKGDDFTFNSITGDASFRRYFRVLAAKNRYVLMYSQPERVNPQPFIELNETFRAAGINVPKILACDTEQGFVLLEDLGELHLADKLQETSKVNHYQSLIKLIPKIAKVPSHSAMKPYDDDFIRLELNIFKAWLIEDWLKIRLTETQEVQWTRLNDWLVNEFKLQPQVTMHRDFHSRNVMYHDDKWFVIDYQDAVQGPVTYDLVSLLRDCYVKLPSDEFELLYQSGFDALNSAGCLGDMSAEIFRQAFDLTGLQRHLKAAGIFCRLWRRDGKAGYLPNILPTLDYIRFVAEKYQQSQWLATWIVDDIIPAVIKKLREKP